MSQLLDPLFASPEIAALFSERATLQAMLDVEAALAAALAQAGVIPVASVPPIQAACRAALFDLAAIGGGAALAGNLAIPLVKALTAQVAAADREAARHVHWGATSQDIQDTGLVLQLRAANTALDADLLRLEDALADLARRHAGTVLAGRTLLQQAVPITLGLKAAGWLDAVRRARRRLAEAARACTVLQFGGAAGTLASLGDKGLAVTEALAAALGLDPPPLPWHAHRGRLVDLGCALGLLCGTLGKLARDIGLMAQTELGEAAEPDQAGRGGSSTMPHKRNPVGCAVALAAAQRAPGLVATLLAAMVQEHERGLGGWHAEWGTLPELVRLASGALRHMAVAAEGLELDPVAMRANLDRTGGLAMAEAVAMHLADRLGKADAHRLVEAAARQARARGLTFAEALAAAPEIAAHLDATAIARLLDPATYLGSAGAFIARVLEPP